MTVNGSRRGRSVGGAIVIPALVWWCTVVTVLVGVLPRRARADGGSVAVHVEGQGAEAVRRELVGAVPPGVRVVPPAELEGALAQEGIDHVGSAASPRSRRALSAKMRRIAKSLDANAVLLGTIRAPSAKGDPELHLVMTTSAAEAPVVDERIPLRPGEDRRQRWKQLVGDRLALLPTSARPAPGAAAAPAAAPAPGGSATPAATAEPSLRPTARVSDASNETIVDRAGAATSASPTTALAILAVGLDFGARQFHYNERVTNGTLRPYDLPRSILFPVAPGLLATGELYPLSTSQLGVLRDIGLTFGFRTNFAKAQVAEVRSSTSWYSWDAALRARFHLGVRGASPVIGGRLGMGQTAFRFSDAGAFQDLLPDVNYRYVRVGADARVPLGAWSLVAGAGYRKLLSTEGATESSIPAAGSLGEHFPDASIAGVDLEAGIAWRFETWLEARFAVDYAHFWAKLHPRVGSAYVAGGAAEQLLHANVGLAASF